jgi:hypothetical protein
MAFAKKFGGPMSDMAANPTPPASPVKKKKSKPFGKKGGFQKKGFTPAMKSMRGGGRY